MRFREISEARKNPDLNPKVLLDDEIARRLSQTKDELPAGVPNLYVSFTDLDKLGINPRSSFLHTPLGIYAHSAQLLVDEGIDPEDTAAADAKFANIFKARGNIIDLSSVTDSEFRMYGSKVTKLWMSVSGSGSSKSEISQILQDAPSKARDSSPGGKLCYVIETAAKRYFTNGWNLKTPMVAWNKLFRVVGIDGVYDPGLGLISPYTKILAVFFSIKSIYDNDRVINNYSEYYTNLTYPSYMRQRQRQSSEDADKLIANMTPDQQIQHIINTGDVESWSGKRYLNYNVLRRVTDPQVRKYFIKQDPHNITYFRHPSDEEQLLAVSMSLDSIVSHRDLLFDITSEPAQLKLIQYDPKQFLKLKKSTPKVMQHAVTHSSGADKEKIVRHAANIGLQPWTIQKTAR